MYCDPPLTNFIIDELDAFIESNRAKLRHIELGDDFNDGNKELEEPLQSFL